jgi:hypothetical protein
MGGKVEVRPGVVALRSIGHSAQESEGGGGLSVATNWATVR